LLFIIAIFGIGFVDLIILCFLLTFTFNNVFIFMILTN